MEGSWLIRVWHSFSTAGLLLATLFFAASLTPSLLPRTYLTQGILSGCSLTAGYGLGVFGQWLWTYMELPKPGGSVLRVVKLVLAAICTFVAVAFLWQAAHWQNSIRILMGLDPVASAEPLEIGLIALATFAVLIVLARVFRLTLAFISRRVNRFLPGRVANVVGLFAAVMLFWSVITGVLFRVALHLADSSFQEFDALIEPENQQPTDASRTGSHASLLKWDELGRAGREFISSGPTSGDISAFAGRQALEPIRVYVGLRSAESVEERARLALEELKRVAAFERSVLVVVTPTGTGWVDPAAMDSLEYLRNGDVASVALQYSYLSSWLSLLLEPGYGADAARALFKEVYGYWSILPRDHRPKLYLHGVSLGAMNSELSTDLVELLGDPISGALWSGPPYASRLWRWTTANRNPGSPAWLPLFRDGSFVRFMNQYGVAASPGSQWGPMRILYLQYASDPVTFFGYRYAYREPDWMRPPRGPDVSPEMRWYPIVTMLQLLVDISMALGAPIGHGHVFAPEHYIDGWVEVTDIRDWSPQELARLKKYLAGRL
ncbi:alpha/beta-hydrolase family protein [Mesorhizobium sp. BAC0120]|uniref:alpha/beta hydrolase n=1 Tax=Mesorhizobium sp. BAC0120 TaxID=3090670 RepID=UPI00298D07B9|nr:alpha/beta-hydrolase family protein [Mesorhizobium sp. BAC0120]MDW6025952.1 alpha/beta-hydrolase family protein [Mesorhizobium sp. BAC0120]